MIDHASRNRKLIANYIYEMLRKVPLDSDSSRSVHLVLESKNVAELYFNEYFHQCRKVIADFNIARKGRQKGDFAIRTITSSNYHSISALLFAGNLPINEVNEFCWQIRHCIELADQTAMEHKFNAFSWAKLVDEKMREIEEETWKNRFDIFEYVEEGLNGGTEENFFDEHTARILIENSKAMMNDALEETLNYVAEEISRSEETENFEERVEMLRKRFSVAKGGKKDYRHESRERNRLSREFYEELVDKFSDFIPFIMYSSPNILNPIVEHLNPEERKVVWKGLILCSALSSLKIKNLIRRILSRMNYAPNITLKEFYQASPSQIQLNFLVVESVEQIMRLVNHITRPNMPVWAAILATCSLPFFFNQVTEHKEWRSKEGKNKNANV